ncbi:MAG: hypothetical protein FJX80_15145 [Bacteroidetes bacterium]|nr:hypothetical protein [Bacteroidota bacterium]
MYTTTNRLMQQYNGLESAVKAELTRHAAEWVKQVYFEAGEEFDNLKDSVYLDVDDKVFNYYFIDIELANLLELIEQPLQRLTTGNTYLWARQLNNQSLELEKDHGKFCIIYDNVIQLALAVQKGYIK